MKIVEYGLFYWTVVGVLALLAASPFLSRVLIYPRTEFFTELWILDADHKAENYPSNITRGQNYTIYLSIGNHLGYCAYYMVQVKFLNWSQLELMPTRFGPIEKRLPSSLPSLFNFTAFVADEQVYETPVTFSFNYTWDQPPSKVELSSLMFNGMWLNMSDYTISWNTEKQGFRGFLFFELWLYNNSAGSFQYHGRFVGLWFNMTVQ
ncbi:DUF1616 domain-containing protein [Candidatus Bathyarchaeota archaeon]|nr:DUF1616 domain-containing protein [Candidatus Bathyarchaeota archaeon]